MLDKWLQVELVDQRVELLGRERAVFASVGCQSTLHTGTPLKSTTTDLSRLGLPRLTLTARFKCRLLKAEL